MRHTDRRRPAQEVGTGPHSESGQKKHGSGVLKQHDDVGTVWMRQAGAEIAQPGGGQSTQSSSHVRYQRRTASKHDGHRHGRHDSARKNGGHAAPIHLDDKGILPGQLDIPQRAETDDSKPGGEWRQRQQQHTPPAAGHDAGEGRGGQAGQQRCQLLDEKTWILNSRSEVIAEATSSRSRLPDTARRQSPTQPHGATAVVAV